MRHSTRASISFSRNCSTSVSSTPRRNCSPSTCAVLQPARCNLFEAQRIGIAKGEIFKLSADLAHAEAMGQRSINIQRFAGDGFLAFRLQVLERAHIVQPVSQLDEHNAHIGHHGQQHLANVFGLAVFSVGELNFVDLGDALNDVGHLFTELCLDLFAGGGRVFNSVVEQAGGNGCRIHLHFGQNFRNFQEDE